MKPEPLFPVRPPAVVSRLEPYRRRWRSLEEAARPRRALWRQIEEHEAPARGWWLTGAGDTPFDETVAAREQSAIVNNAILGARRGVAGMLWTGLTSESRHWFSLSVGDDRAAPSDPARYDEGFYDLYGETAPVRGWLSVLADTCRRVLCDANFYSEIFGVYDDAAAYGTAALLLEDDSRTVLRSVRLPVGSYWVAQDEGGRVTTLYRRFVMTAGQIEERFGLDHAPERAERALRDGRPDERFVVFQAMQPVANAPRADGSDRPPAWAEYESVFFPEVKAGDDNAPMAREWYRKRPFIVFRWALDGSSPYGSRCPGMDCLGDCRTLQQVERLKLQVLEHFAKPPILADPRVKDSLDNRAGGVTWVNVGSGDTRLTASLYPERFAASAQVAQALQQESQLIAQRVENAHYSSLMFSVLFQNKQMTAAEVAARQEEKTMLAGPLVQRFENDLLAPVLDRVIDAILWNGLMPPPPPELSGTELAYEYSGPLAMTAKMMSLSNLERALQTVMAFAQANPAMLDKVDFDQFVDVVADQLKVDPSVIRDDARVAEIRQAKAQEAQAMMDRQQASQEAVDARNLAGAQLGQGNMLDAALASRMGAQGSAGGL